MAVDREMLEFLFAGPLYTIYNQLNQIERKINKLDRKVETQMGAVQDAVNALAAKLDESSNQLTQGLSEVQQEISRLQSLPAGEEVDLSQLSQKVDAVAEKAQALDNVVPDAVQELPPDEGTGEPIEPPTPTQLPTEGTTSPGEPG
jgi:chromosome segregation ATPase